MLFGRRIRSVMEWAIRMDLRNDNRAMPVFGPPNDIVQRPLALPHKDVAAVIEKVRASSPAQPTVKLAFESRRRGLVTCGWRRGPRWTRRLRVERTALRTKAKCEHRVPL